jgi:hypothetical protein
MATAAMTVTATASAAQWTQGGGPLGENAAATFEGQLTFTGKIYSVTCATTIEATLEPGGTGTVEVFDFGWPFDNCSGSGALTGCSLASTVMAPQELPWGFSPKSPTEIELGDVTLYNHFFGGCIGGGFEQTLEGDLVAFPDSSENISTIAFKGAESGVLTSSGGAEVTASGTLQASFDPEGEYGIEE